MVSRNSTEDGLKQTTTRPIDCPPFTAHSLWMAHWMVPSKTQKHKPSRVLNRVQLPAETWSAAVWDPFSIYFENSFLSRSVNEVLFSHLFHYRKFPFSWVRCSCVLNGWRVICPTRFRWELLVGSAELGLPLCFGSFWVHSRHEDALLSTHDIMANGF